MKQFLPDFCEFLIFGSIIILVPFRDFAIISEFSSLNAVKSLCRILR